MKAETKDKDCDRYIDRPFNVRPICFWAFFVGLTLVVCNWACSINAVYFVAVYFALLIAVFFALQFLKTKDKLLLFLGSSRLFFCGLVLLCLLSALTFTLTTMAYTNQKSYAGYHELRGVVESYNVRGDGSGYFLLINVMFDSAEVSGKVMVYAQDFELQFVTFDIISVETQLRKAEANDYNINNGVKYTANIKAKDVITVVGEDGSLRSNIMRYSRSILAKGLDKQNADLMYSMLFGDKSTLDGELQNSFRLTGLAHVLAVSGMHVGLIVGLLIFILNLFKVSKKRQLYIIFCVLLFYCYLCGFRYSILRACIMFLVFSARRTYLQSTDFWSSLCLAGIIILVLFPYSLYSVSFQLSFACMFGIGLFYLPLKRFFGKQFINDNRWREDARAVWHFREIKLFIVKWLCDGVAMYLCVTVACLPLMIKYFGMISVVGLFANILILPFIILAFQACVIVIVTWVAFPVLFLLNPLIDIILSVTNWMAGLPFSTVTITGGDGDAFLIYLIGTIFITRFIFLKRKLKHIVSAVCVAFYTIIVIFF